MHFTEKGRTACGLRVKRSQLFRPWFSYCFILRGHSFKRAYLLDKKWIPGDGGFCIDLGPVQEEGVVILLVPVWYGTQFEVWCLMATELQQLKVLKLSVL